ncbi:hypothetical protein FEP92_02830 [Burkholderia multivorans]|uniref:DUF6311 domain-containing protein n=1 Tax=Burkholderia multivorans TaxID=87883 RepID=UPI002857F2D5|nr:DUF6311 domain-containing protein [Burkholderia multivorans]MDR8772443.1 hypothetical protein [Burkholderia multivorans]MDR8864173.1 hypothetical protein [Burkholderia multivorans]
MQKMVNSSNMKNLIVPTLIGVAIFLLFTGGRIVNPVNLDWIMAPGGDPIQHYIGWNFFRHGPYFEFPLGLNPQYGEKIGSSVVFSDSIPVLAIFFKLIRGVLPINFQYFGLWIIACFVLQAIFAWKILSLYTPEAKIKCIGCALLTLSPPMLWRLLGHEALVGHWLLLAGLYLYLRRNTTTSNWAVLMCVSAVIHPYLLAMVAAIWVADVIRDFLSGEAVNRAILVEILCVTMSVGVVTWAAGYFAVKGVGSDGFGYYRFNITSPIHPLDIWSIWRKTPYVGGDYEGFSYPGAGIFVLAALSVVLVVLRRRQINISWPRNGTLIALCVGFYLYALSNRIAFGGHEILQYSVPSALMPIVSTFRSTGRFIWPVVYAIEILLLFIVIALAPKKLAVPLLTVCLLFQATDLIPASKYFRERWSHRWNNPLSSEFWADAGKQYKRVAFVLPLDGGDRYAPIAFMASNAGMSINGGYFARVDFDKLRKVEEELLGEVNASVYRHDTLYVFNTEKNWNVARSKFKGDGFLGLVDGFRVIAPDWKGCVKECNLRAERTENNSSNALIRRYLDTGRTSRDETRQ